MADTSQGEGWWQASGRAAVALAVVLALALAACGDDSGGSGDAARFCELGDEGEALAEPTTAEELEEWLSDLQRVLTEAAAVAPDEIRDDVVLYADTVNGITTEEVIAAGESGENPADTPELRESDLRIDAWVEENCTDG